MKEKELSIVLGLSRDLIKELRTSYKEGEDWTRLESKKPQTLWEVDWSESGVRKLKMNLGIDPVKELASPEEKNGIVKGNCKNIRMLRVLIDGKEHNVICRDNTKFRTGMDVTVKWDGTRWCVVKHPRFNGKY
jgi:hypothetical protein